jgi:hypothetical protein
LGCKFIFYGFQNQWFLRKHIFFWRMTFFYRPTSDKYR